MEGPLAKPLNGGFSFWGPIPGLPTFPEHQALGLKAGTEAGAFFGATPFLGSMWICGDMVRVHYGPDWGMFFLGGKGGGGSTPFVLTIAFFFGGVPRLGRYVAVLSGEQSWVLSNVVWEELLQVCCQAY